MLVLDGFRESKILNWIAPPSPHFVWKVFRHFLAELLLEKTHLGVFNYAMPCFLVVSLPDLKKHNPIGFVPNFLATAPLGESGTGWDWWCLRVEATQWYRYGSKGTKDRVVEGHFLWQGEDILLGGKVRKVGSWWDDMRCKMERVGMKGRGGVRETCAGDRYHVSCSCDLPKFGLVWW